MRTSLTRNTISLILYSEYMGRGLIGTAMIIEKAMYQERDTLIIRGLLTINYPSNIKTTLVTREQSTRRAGDYEDTI